MKIFFSFFLPWVYVDVTKKLLKILYLLLFREIWHAFGQKHILQNTLHFGPLGVFLEFLAFIMQMFSLLISFLETVLNVWRIDNVLLESYNVIYPFQMGYTLKHCCKHLQIIFSNKDIEVVNFSPIFSANRPSRNRPPARYCWGINPAMD